MPEPRDAMDQRLRQYADRWRDTSEPEPKMDIPRLVARSRMTRNRWLVVASAAAVAAATVGATQLVGGSDPAGPGPAAPTPSQTSPADVVPWAPLPASHPEIPGQTSTPSPDPADAIGKPECRASDLRATASSGPAAGTTYETVRLELTGDHPCRLQGIPHVELLDQGRPVDIPLEQQTDDSTYHDPVLVAPGHPALVRLSWSKDWCATPAHNDTIRLVLPGGSLSFEGLGGSDCYGVPGSGTRAPINVAPFQPVTWRDAKVVTAYRHVDVSGDLPLTADPGDAMVFTITLTSPQDLVLDPCPDYRIVQNASGEPREESYALNCAAVPFKDDHGRPYLPAGTPVRFAMQARTGDPGLYKFSWSLEVADAHGAGGVLTVSGPTPNGDAGTADSGQHAQAIRAGSRAIQAFLDEWRTQGLLVASRHYATSDQMPESSAGLPRISSGTVLHTSLSSWASPEHFTLEVSLDLRFEGDPLAWDQGQNLRFVTVTRTGSETRLTFATSP
jgi:hypothetical protein